MGWRIPLLLSLAYASGSLALAAPTAAPPASAEEALLKAAGLPTDAAGLLEFFRLRTSGSTSAEKLAGLIDRLGAASAAERERACAELVGLGPVAIPVLRQAVKDPDQAQAAALAQRCLHALEENSSALTTAAVRLLAQRKPSTAGKVGTQACEALLGLLLVAEDEGVIEEAQRALLVVGYRDGKVDPALEAALDDKVAIRRASAVEVLCQNGRSTPRPLLRRLLRDPAPVVRLRAALTLATDQDAGALPVLIDLLADLPLAQGRQAEDFLAALAGDLAPKVALADDDVSRRNCRAAWRAWWEKPPDNLAPAGLLGELRKRSLTEADRLKAQKLIDRLGDDGFQRRQQASSDLKELGPVVVPLLRQAARGKDPEINQRAQDLLDQIDKKAVPPLPPTVLRLLALRRPEGTAEALLGFLPCAEDEALLQEAQQALNGIAAQGERPDPALVRALEDRAGIRRAAAAEALCHAPGAGHLPAVRKLLKDPEASVRARAALALAGRGEQREAVPVLIALVGELPAEAAVEIEEYLRGLCGDLPPPSHLGGSPSGDDARVPEKRQQAWAAWWEAHGRRVDLQERPAFVAATRHLGYTLLVQPQHQQVVEVDQHGKVRWQVGGLGNPQDAVVLPGDRVLVAEFSANKVTERNLRGEVLWEKAVPGQPIGVQRLPGGNTLIVLRNQLLEVDRTGRAVFTHNRPFHDLMAARKLRDGQIVCLSSQGLCFHLDRAGKQGKSFRVQGVTGWGNEVLPGGGVVVPLTWQNRVTEYDAEGKVVWEAQVVQPQAAHRLPNGHTLIASQQWPPRILELDRAGKQVAETSTNSLTVRVRRR